MTNLAMPSSDRCGPHRTDPALIAGSPASGTGSRSGAVCVRRSVTRHLTAVPGSSRQAAMRSKMNDTVPNMVRPARPSAWTPLAIPSFRALWLASLASNIGIWLGNIGIWLGNIGIWLGNIGIWLGNIGIWLGNVGTAWLMTEL